MRLSKFRIVSIRLRLIRHRTCSLLLRTLKGEWDIMIKFKKNKTITTNKQTKIQKKQKKQQQRRHIRTYAHENGLTYTNTHA